MCVKSGTLVGGVVIVAGCGGNGSAGTGSCTVLIPMLVVVLCWLIHPVLPVIGVMIMVALTGLYPLCYLRKKNWEG